jgi:hypothetical protein
MADELWPALPYEAWKETYATLHMWMQIVGKVALATAPPLNHSWGIALQIGPRGISTRTLACGPRSFTIAFDFIDHQLVISASDGDKRTLPLQPQTVAEFHHDVMATLDAMRLTVKIWPMPVEVPSPIRFDQDTLHRSYDPVYANRCWRLLSRIARVLSLAQCEFVGKCSPVHFFWGSFDLAVTRFSGRRAPRHPGGVPHLADEVACEAYSHEVSSAGFWPGSGSIDFPAFYSYAYPEPPGFRTTRVRPKEAFFSEPLGEFILPYDVVRTATQPDQMLLDFLQSTYEAAANSAQWDRGALECTPGVAGVVRQI